MHTEMNNYFKFFSRIAVGLMQRQDSSALIQKLINEAVELIGADFGYVHLVDEKQQRLRIVAAANADVEAMDEVRLRKGEAMAGYCWEIADSVIINDYDTWDRRITNKPLSVMKSACAVPLLRNGKVFGVLGLGAYTKNRFREADIEVVSHFGDVATVAFDNANLIDQLSSELKRNTALTDELRLNANRYRELFEKTERRLKQSEVLVRISSLINSDISLDRLAARVQEASMAALTCDDVRIFRIYDRLGASDQVLSNELDANGTMYNWQEVNDAVADLLMQREDAEASTDTVSRQRLGTVTHIGSVPILILLIQDAVSPWGAIVASLHKPDDQFADEDRQILGAIANQFTMAVRQRSLLARTEHQANHDELTSLANRRLFKQRVREALVYCKSNDASLSLLIFDLDGFKKINDIYGHQVGDLVLCAVADRMKSSVPPDATVARLGGDEFAVLLSNECKGYNDTQVAEQLLGAIEQPVTISEKILCVGASVGISRFPAHGTEYSDLMIAADAAMYSVKTAGASGFKLYISKRSEQADHLDPNARDFIAAQAGE